MTTNPSLLTKVPSRGEIWLVDFDPVIGDEIMKRRPAVVVSSDGIKSLKLKIVVPVTKWQEKFSASYWLVKIIANTNNGLDCDSAADALQLRSVSYKRFASKLGTISVTLLDEICAAVDIVIESQ